MWWYLKVIAGVFILLGGVGILIACFVQDFLLVLRLIAACGTILIGWAVLETAKNRDQ